MKKLLARLGAGALVLAAPAITFAQFNSTDFRFQLPSFLSPIRPVGGNFDLPSLAAAVLNFVILVAAIIAILYLIWAGIQYITASTDEEKAKKARAAIYNAIIGIVVIVLSYVIIQYVTTIARKTVEQNINGGGVNGTGSLDQFGNQQP